tara:strand:- start:329 stop:511 length:183 start_codon:yes stop_codon:yes gene_type:complete
MTDENKQDQKWRVVADGNVISENFDSIMDAMEWAKTMDQVLAEKSSVAIETYLKPKLLLD